MKNRAYTDVPWSGHESQDWCRLWATECLRVLKPGAEPPVGAALLSWAGRKRLAAAERQLERAKP